MKLKWLMAFTLLLLTAACRTLTPDDAQRAAHTKTLGQIIRDANRPVHVMFVHGMRATGAGNAEEFEKALEAAVRKRFHGPVTVTKEQRVFLDVGPWPKDYVDGRRVWRNEEEWERSRPFIDRTTVVAGDRIVVVDEFNWWPLLFPVKCRLLVLPEITLAGPDTASLNLCTSNANAHFPWLTQEEIATAEKLRHSGSGGAWINASIKRSIMDWGLSDAVVSVGPLRAAIRKGLNQAFDQAADLTVKVGIGPETPAGVLRTFNAKEQQFAVVSESLGSFVVLDALESGIRDHSPSQDVWEQTGYLYFFANQFALLELGRVAATEHGIQLNSIDPSSPSGESQSPLGLLRQWAGVSSPKTLGYRPDSVVPPSVRTVAKQVVAFSDSSDLLTFDVPQLCDKPQCEDLLVVNFHVRNATRWFGLLANPIKAHTGHASNPAVLGEVFRTE